jgi:NADH-quinone oxidoreductase subunit G
MSGNEVLRVTGRKDRYGELESFICNDCRYDKKSPSDWTIEGPRNIERQSVISQNHYMSLRQLKIDVSKQKELAEKAHREKQNNQ